MAKECIDETVNPLTAAVPAGMAAHSLISAFFLHSSATPLTCSQSTTKIPKFSISKTLSFRRRSVIVTPVSSFLKSRNKLEHNPKLTCVHNLLHTKNPFSSALDSILLLCTSVALSISLFVTDVDPASAFVVTPPRKLQIDELATVRLFQENTPSVVYITNLAVRYFFFIL